MSAKQIFAIIGSFALTALLAISAAAQSNISGDVTGIITDPSGAVLPNVPVTLTNNDTGVTRTNNTNGAGVYRFSLLEPGKYTVAASPQGFQEVKRAITVAVGQASTVNVQMAVAGGSQTVEVSAEGVVLQTEGGNISTTFTPEQVSQMPNPGNDLTFFVQTAPGAVMNTQTGYGNEAIYGLPGTSNLFTVDGSNENDPFLNLNNSGATNLLLGANDIQEVTVVSNGYQAQYGQLGGANVNYVTKSGTNKFHGNAEYFWNGSYLNANDWFANHTSPITPRPFDNANQWAASFGGPIRKNKTFFFVNTEGLRFVLPSVISTNIPSPQFQAATLANVAGTSAAQVPFYTNMFNLYNGAVGANRAANILPNGTDSVTGAPTGPGCVGFSPFANATTPCALQFQSTAPNQSNEWLLTARVDQNFGSNDRMFAHFRTDHGSQASYTDSINPVFNAVSKQPQYEGQLNETHTFSGTMVNQFIMAGSWYSAIFSTANLGASLATFPYTLRFSGQAFTTLGGLDNIWPQGRNVTQYQFSDLLSLTHGRHNLGFGVDFRRNDITDYDPSIGSVGLSTGETLSSFFSGTGVNYTQGFPTRLTQPIALYTLGLYAQDTWSVRPNLKVTLALRAEHNSNPICVINCFSRFNTSFTDIPHDPNQPYNQVLHTGFHQALPNYTNIAWQPRFGFAWTPLGTGSNTVIRGGVGIFRDVFPATVADNFIRNPPTNNAFTVGTGALTPAVPGSQTATASASNSVFLSQYSTGGTLASISAAVPAFVPPTLFNPDRTIHYPQYQEWNLQLQQGLGQKMSFAVGYVGNHGIYEPVINDGQNAYCNVTPLPFAFSAATAPCATQLGITTPYRGLPTAPLDPRFGTINEIGSNAVSNYNGLTTSYTIRWPQLQVQANYTWSHALDEVSNGGFLPFNYNFVTGNNWSVLQPQNPFNLRQFNYGNSDYDTRHSVNGNVVWTTPKVNNKFSLLEAWTVSGNLFFRTGLPFTAYDSATTGLLSSFNFGPPQFGNNIFANYPAATPISCSTSATSVPCFTTSQFSPATTGFGLQRRNQLYGPRYFDIDLGVTKNFKLPFLGEAGNFGLGLQAYNVLNHPNFDQPVGDIGSSQFGTIINTVNPPTSVLGSFLGAKTAPRMLQIKGVITF